MSAIRSLTLAALIITCYYFIYYIYTGFINPTPALGDSWDYHIPISKSILDGSFLSPHYKEVKQYFPGASETINSIFIYFNIPLTLSNIFAIFVLTICCYKLAITFRLNQYYALLFALTFVTTNSVIRWMNAVSVDIWIAVYFSVLLILLEKPKKSLLYFLILGFFTGMMIGSKYSAITYVLILFLFYIRKLYPIVNWQRIAAFMVPFTMFGLFWYLRNFIATNNPFYPISIFGLPGIKNFGGYMTTKYSIWNMSLNHPIEMLNAGFGEYKLWLFSIFIILGALIYQIVKNRQIIIDQYTKILLIGIALFFLSLTFHTEEHAWIMVSSYRYTFPVFISMMLGVFIIAAKYKKEHLIGIISIASMINIMSMAYYPKLLIIYLPLAILIFYFFEKNINNLKSIKKVNHKINDKNVDYSFGIRNIRSWKRLLNKILFFK